MKTFLALLAAAVLAAGCHNGGINQNSTDMRALNAVIDAEPLDVLVDGDEKFAAVAPDNATSYANFSSGSREVVVRSGTNQAVLYDKSVNFASDSRGTLLVYGHRNALATLLLADDTATPSSGKTRVRFAGLAVDAGNVDVYLASGDLASVPPVVSGAAPGAVSAVAEVTAGAYKLVVTTAGTQDILFQSATAVTLAAGDDVTLAIMPSLGGKLVNAMVIEPCTSGTVTLVANPVARVKAVNAIADSAALNYKADGNVLLTSVPFAGVSSYVGTPSGPHVLGIEMSNVPGSTIASASSDLGSARDFTVLATGAGAAPAITVLADDNTPPAAGNARVRFVNAMSGGNVDALVNFASETQGLAPGSASGYFTIPAGTAYTITFTSPGGVNVVATLSGVELDAGNVYTAYAFGSAANAQAKLVRDR